MASIQVNVFWEDGVFKYSTGNNTPITDFVHEFHVNDEITWHYGKTGHHVKIAFENDICPFARADGTPWPGKAATFPDQASKLHAGFDRNRLRTPIKYSVTLVDEKDAPKHDPEVIIVD
jgi:hypothetical protein